MWLRIHFIYVLRACMYIRDGAGAWRVAWRIRRGDNARTIAMTERATRDSVQRTADVRVCFVACSLFQKLRDHVVRFPTGLPLCIVIRIASVTIIRKSERSFHCNLNWRLSLTFTKLILQFFAVLQKIGVRKIFASTIFVSNIFFEACIYIDKSLSSLAATLRRRYVIAPKFLFLFFVK